MLRVTNSECAGARRILLEGDVTASEISLVDASIREARPAGITLDLEGVRWIDGAAAAWLHALRGEGVAVTGCSPFLERLLVAHQRG